MSDKWINCLLCNDTGWIHCTRPKTHKHYFAEPIRCTCEAGREVQCKTCHDKGFVRKDVPVGHPDFGKAFYCPDCRAGISKSLERLSKVSRLNQRELNTRLDDLDLRFQNDTANMVTQARRVIGGEISFLTLIGSTGVGKTTILYAIAGEFIRHGKPAIYLDWTDLLDFIRDGFNPQAEHHNRDEFDKVLRAPVVCMDEIDKAKPTDWALEQLHRFVNYRWKRALDSPGEWLVTVFAMNREPADEHIRSRLLDTRFQTVYNQDMDYRMA